MTLISSNSNEVIEASADQFCAQNYSSRCFKREDTKDN